MSNSLQDLNPKIGSQSTSLEPILPRNSWQDKQAWLKEMIKTKKALEKAEKKFFQPVNALAILTNYQALYIKLPQQSED
jgi:hypothetical protein